MKRLSFASLLFVLLFAGCSVEPASECYSRSSGEHVEFAYSHSADSMFITVRENTLQNQADTALVYWRLQSSDGVIVGVADRRQTYSGSFSIPFNGKARESGQYALRAEYFPMTDDSIRSSWKATAPLAITVRKGAVTDVKLHGHSGRTCRVNWLRMGEEKS